MRHASRNPRNQSATIAPESRHCYATPTSDRCQRSSLGGASEKGGATQPPARSGPVAVTVARYATSPESRHRYATPIGGASEKGWPIQLPARIVHPPRSARLPGRGPYSKDSGPCCLSMRQAMACRTQPLHVTPGGTGVPIMVSLQSRAPKTAMLAPARFRDCTACYAIMHRRTRRAFNIFTRKRGALLLILAVFIQAARAKYDGPRRNRLRTRPTQASVALFRPETLNIATALLCRRHAQS